jgi:ABC-type lipoprotein export system ATPase subunit
VTVGWNVSRPIVSNINLQIKKNSLTAIIGPVGSGKSTVMAPQSFWLLYSLCEYKSTYTDAEDLKILR